MRKITLIIVAIMCVMTSCASSKSNIVNADNGDGKVTRTLPLTGFSGIDISASVVRLNYTQSDKYSVKVTATEQRMETMDIQVRDGMLCVAAEPSDNGNNTFEIKNDDIEMEVSCPQMSKLNVSGGADIFLSDISIDNGFSLNNKGNLAMKTKSIKARDISISNSNNMVLGIDDSSSCGDLTISNSGNFILGMKDVKARKTVINNSGNGSLKSGTIEGTAMNVTQTGAMLIELTFKGDNVSVDNNGNSDITLNVECGKLRITNNGAASLEVSGTADDVKIDGSGSSNVDNSRLNKF